MRLNVYPDYISFCYRVNSLVTHLSNTKPKIIIEGGSSENDLREAGGGTDGAGKMDAPPVPGNAVQRLRPPLVGGDAESRNRCGRVNELGGLFVEGEARHEVLGSLGNGQSGLAKWVRFGLWI